MNEQNLQWKERKQLYEQKEIVRTQIEQKQTPIFVVTKQKSKAFFFFSKQAKGQNFCQQKSCKTSFWLPCKKLTPENSTLFYKKHVWASTQTDNGVKKKTWAEKKNSFAQTKRELVQREKHFAC